MNDHIRLQGPPTADSHASTKKYVDDNVAAAPSGRYLPQLQEQ